MPLTAQQRKRIMRNGAHIPEQVNYAGRVAENYLRKKLYRWEDLGAKANYETVKALSRDVREFVLYAANQARVSTIGNDAPSTVFRRMANEYLTQRMGQFVNAVAWQSYGYAVTGYTAGWYLRQWQLHSATHGQIKPVRVSNLNAQKQVLAPMQEAVTLDGGVYDYAGSQWRSDYLQAGTQALLKLRRQLNQTVIKPVSPLALTQQFNDTLGADGKGGLYHSVQVNTRTAVMRSANVASQDVYGTHTEFILGAIFVTSRDDRVCPICQRLEGKVVVVNDLLAIALLGLPPDSTHYGCRCTYVPFVIPVDKPNEPPQDTFEEWLHENGFYSELDEFMSDDMLESTQV